MKTLHEAIVLHSLDEIKEIIASGTDVNQLSNGLTPLHYAACLGFHKCVKLLLERGAKTDIKEPIGWTALEMVSGLVSVQFSIVCASEVHASKSDYQDTIKLLRNHQTWVERACATTNAPEPCGRS